MLHAAGARITVSARAISIRPGRELRLPDVNIPGDFSSAAPFLVAATLIPGSRVTIRGVSLNSLRTGLLTVLRRMGGQFTISARSRFGNEPVGNIEVRHARLTATAIDACEVPLLIDELPLFALLASHAHGESRVSGATELRVKESDRIDALSAALQAIGARVQAYDDGFSVTGARSRLLGGTVDARGDHRIAMLGAVAGLASVEGTIVHGAETTAVSFPEFFELLEQVGAQ